MKNNGIMNRIRYLHLKGRGLMGEYSEDGFWGKIQEARKRVGATLIDTFVSSDPAKATK
jgi:hypothetical protein